MLRLLFLLYLFVSPAAAIAAGAAQTILVIGDSLSAAYGIDTDSGWTRQLAERLSRKGHAYSVVNASISGDTTGNGLARLPQALERHRPRIVIIALGGNDGLRGLPLAAMRQNLERMVALSRAAGARVLLLGVRLPPNYGPAYREKFQDVYATVARDTKVPLVPFLLDGVGGRDELMQSDGLHPRAEAQARMLDNVWPSLVPLLTR